MSKRRIIILGVVALIVAAVASWAFLFSRFVHVPTGAMANTILPGDSLVVDRLFGQIKRGDIIIFKYPQDHSVRYVSRVRYWGTVAGELITGKPYMVYWSVERNDGSKKGIRWNRLCSRLE
jgi:signal peptidase I